MNAHELPAGAEVTWIVRNSGVEAEADNDLVRIDMWTEVSAMNRGMVENEIKRRNGTFVPAQ
jgi:hypothetical protein